MTVFSRFVVALFCLLSFGPPVCRSQTEAAGLPKAVLRQVLNRRFLPKGQYTPVRTWQAEGKSVGHNTGREVADTAAEGGKAWGAQPGRDAAGMLIFGPYLKVPPGDYCALFRIKLPASNEGETVGRLDACVAYGQNILASRALAGDDLASGRYVWVPLAFHDPGGPLECRLDWRGETAVRLDSIALYRLKGADLKDVGRVPPAQPTGKPNHLVPVSKPRPFPDIFPRSKTPAADLLVCDLRKEPPDRRVLFLTLEGIVNRRRPKIYCLCGPTDARWLQWLVHKQWIKKAVRVKNNDRLLHRYRNRLKGMVITDPRLPASINVATMIASVEDGVVVSPRLAKQFSLPVLDDLRGKWTTSAAAYRWAFNHLWPRLNHHIIACLWPDDAAPRDYLVENKVFIFWISGPIDGARRYASPQAEVALMEQLLAKMPVNMPVMGYPWAGQDVGIGEGPGVSLFAEFGKYLVGSVGCANLSVHSGIAVGALRQKSAPPPPRLDPTKVYLAWVISDGDNLPVLMNHNYPQLWKQPTRGNLPLGWTLSPSASVLIPDIVSYYYATATPDDEFLGAVSGVGYTYPDLYGNRFRQPYRRQVFDGFLRQTARYMRRSDERDLWVMNATRPEILRRFAQQIPFLNALFPDYGKRVSTYREATYPTARDVPVFHAVTSWRQHATRAQRIQQLVDDLRAITPVQRPAFLHAFALNWFTDLPMLQEVLKRLGPDYIAVRPDQLAELYRQHLKRMGVWSQFPSSVAIIEHKPLKLFGRLRNVSGAEQDVHIRLLTGLSNASVAPGEVQLAPAKAAAVRLQGIPTGDQVRLQFTGAFGPRQVSIAVHRILTAQLARRLPSTGILAPMEYWEAKSLSHRCGQLESEPGASGGAAWVARKGRTEPGFIVYGPYAPLAKGKYLALFRLKRLGAGSGQVALLDTCVGGGVPRTGRLAVNVGDLPLNQWRWFPILFHHPGGEMETRVRWSGRASLAVDAVALWKCGPETNSASR